MKNDRFFDPRFRLFFYLLYCFVAGVRIQPDFIECVTQLLPDAAVKKQTLRAGPAAFAVRWTCSRMRTPCKRVVSGYMMKSCKHTSICWRGVLIDPSHCTQYDLDARCHVSCACMHTNFVTPSWNVTSGRDVLYCSCVLVLSHAYSLHAAAGSHEQNLTERHIHEAPVVVRKESNRSHLVLES